MKKIIVAFLTLTLLFAALVPVSAATPVLKDYDSAANGDLLYTFNFNGDEVFAPKGTGKAETYFDYIVGDNGASLTIKGKDTCPESGATSNWGAMIKDLPAGKTTTYSFVYKVKANGAGENNKLGIGSWINNKMVTNHVNCYGNYNAPAADGAEAFDNSVCLQAASTKYGSYVKLSDVGEYDQTDGFMTMLVVYDGPNDTATSYTLAKGADGSKAEDWLKVETAKMSLNAIADGVGFMTYCHYKMVDMTIKDAKLYKGTLWTVEETTEAPTTAAPTEAPTTDASVATDAPETDAPATDEGEGGCGCTVSLAGMAIVAALGTCAVAVSNSKKRRK